MTASALSAELEVSVRTVYRDIESLSAAGVPVFTEAGPGGGCQLVEGYRMPLTSLSRDEAAALVTLGIPAPIRELGLAPALESARDHVRAAGGIATEPVTIHVDVPRWFGATESVPHLPAVAEAIRLQRKVDLTYNDKHHRGLGVLGLVNKAGGWYAVVSGTRSPFVLRVTRVHEIKLLGDQFDRPDSFDLVSFWESWATEFQRSLPRLEVLTRASPNAVDAMPEVFGEHVLPLIENAPVDDSGWRVITLTFEHEAAAVARLAGFADQVEVLAPGSVRDRLVATARAIIANYRPFEQ
jgi:predicted DNA-binding transcriptional regulator YafY